MKNTQIENIEAAITEATARLDALNDLIATQRTARLEITAAIDAARADLDAHEPALETLLARQALGENVTGELGKVRAAAADARKRFTTAQERESEVRELASAENGLTRRLDPIQAELTHLYAQKQAVRVDRIKALATDRIAAYTEHALKVADFFAEVLAASEHVLKITGEDPKIVAPESLRICLPGFIGQPAHLMTAGDFPRLKADAAARVDAELAAAGVL